MCSSCTKSFYECKLISVYGDYKIYEVKNNMRYIFKHEASDPPRGNGFTTTNRIIKERIVDFLKSQKDQLTTMVKSADHNTSSNVRGTQLRLDINDTGDGKKKLQLQLGAATYSSVYISAEVLPLFNNAGELLELKNKPTNIPNIGKINEGYSRICECSINGSDKVNNFTTNVVPQLNMLRQKFLQLYTYLKDTCGLAANKTFNELNRDIIADTRDPEDPRVSVMGVDGSIYHLSEHRGLQLFFADIISTLISHIDDMPQIQMVDNEDLNGDTLNDVLYKSLLYSLNNAKVIVLSSFIS